MAAIGMKWAAYAPIATETAGSAITYGTGTHIEHAISANITINRSDAKLSGDDMVVESDRGITGYDIAFNSSELTFEQLATLCGELAPASTGPQKVGDAPIPYGGFGFVQVLRINGVNKFEGYWFYKVQFVLNEINAQTKGESIEFSTPTLNGTGFATDQGDTYAVWYEHQEFATEASAISYIKTKAGIT